MINPSEISQVLKQQLENVNSKVSFEETGTVLEVGDGVAHVYGLDNVCANELVEFENGGDQEAASHRGLTAQQLCIKMQILHVKRQNLHT